MTIKFLSHHKTKILKTKKNVNLLFEVFKMKIQTKEFNLFFFFLI